MSYGVPSIGEVGPSLAFEEAVKGLGHASLLLGLIIVKRLVGCGLVPSVLEGLVEVVGLGGLRLHGAGTGLGHLNSLFVLLHLPVLFLQLGLLRVEAIALHVAGIHAGLVDRSFAMGWSPAHSIRSLQLQFGLDSCDVGTVGGDVASLRRIDGFVKCSYH